MAPRQVPVYRHICIFINKAFCSFLLACLALTLGSSAALWSLEPVQGVEQVDVQPAQQLWAPQRVW